MLRGATRAVRTSCRRAPSALRPRAAASIPAFVPPHPPLRGLPSRQHRSFASQAIVEPGEEDEGASADVLPRAEHAVISTFDLFSIGVGPSSSHTVGPMRAAKIFVSDLEDLGILDKVRKLKIGLYGSLAATGKGHLTPEAIMMGLEGSDPETIETSTVNSRYAAILETGRLQLNGTHTISYSHDKDMLWRMEPLPAHPNGMRFSVFDDEGTLMATNEYFSVGGGFVVNEQTQVDENLYYRGIHKQEVAESRRDQAHGLPPDALAPLALPPADNAPSPNAPVKAEQPPQQQPPYLFRNAAGLVRLTQQHNLTIAQLVWQNERAFLSDSEISEKLLNLWRVMDASIHSGVSSTDPELPGRLRVRRRAPHLYRRLFKGFYPSLLPSSADSNASLPPPPPSSSQPLTLAHGFNFSAPPPASRTNGAPLVVGSFEHPLPPTPRTKGQFPAIDWLSCYAIAVNETNASGGRVVTAPTNGASGVIPAVLKYLIEFISDDPERDIKTFLLTASAIGMLYKRGATISAAEGGCMAEVGVASSMAAGALTACMGGTPSQIMQAAEIGIEHSLGLTCDPIDGLVQVPCIERNSLGAVKAVTAAQLALAGEGVHSVSLDDAIEAMRLTARGMHEHFKETSLSGLATAVKIPLSSPAC
ncbi:L-serine dehydratase [Rhodotorula toruloides]|uniref:BY PROTMAP: gi/472584824/gb/EMS22399.1/ L-serine dehydratase [Rhodosporidium toruloides NP11] gi/647401041/emb/CDR46977.1/ RHTO0S13e04324g1_1 [Rhodosporidium toruloides] n=1 Tax=Rhodotorula toruloides TaxID=5286 RepID=A0A0K3CPK4_RHOTO|nr:L-serine dehydratase [Rhodotorula toruloides]PRQ69828.1 Serine dehydratase alpha chain-domain containing protein [Rhodotorula toruloides]